MPCWMVGGNPAAANGSFCHECRAGRFNRLPGKTDEAFLKKCAAGKWGSVSGAKNEFSCKPCKPGYFSPETALRSEPCKACSAGKFNDLSQSFTFVVQDMPSGYFAMENGSAHCDACTVGRASSREGSIISCDKCNLGQFAPLRVSRVQTLPCWVHQRILMLLLAFPACLAGMVDPGSANCSVCGPGHFQPDAGSVIACQNETTKSWSAVVPQSLMCPLGQ